MGRKGCIYAGKAGLDRDMRAPKRRRPLKRRICVPAGVDLEAAAKQAKYIGSSEHKNAPSPAGAPKLRSDASCCPPAIVKQRKKITDWLRSAIRHGSTGKFWEGHSPRFPRYVWYRHGNTVFEGHLTNQVFGEYKGYPLKRSEWPDDFEAIHAGS